MAASTITLNVTQKNSWLARVRLLALHLAPGSLVMGGFALLAPLCVSNGLPPTLALLTSWILIGLPIQWGYLLYRGWRQIGRPSLAGALMECQSLPGRQAAGLIAALLVWALIANTLFMLLGQALQRTLFDGLPAWLNLSDFARNLDQYSPAVLWLTALASLALNIFVPVTEELYFRGHLLPRLTPFGRWAPLINTVLFSLYHLWAPWDVVTRVVALLPMVYVVWRTRDLRLSLWVHVLLNLTGSVGLIAVLLSR